MPSPARLRQLSLPKPIVLVGMMGAGKTTIGRRLAQRLGLAFADSDREIEVAADMRVSDIFERFGEPYFRDGERRVIARLLEGDRKVLATGGGAFINPETRTLILDRATTVWLDADIDVLVERVARRDDRPLLHGRDAGVVLRDLAAVRLPIYALAPIRVPSHPAPHDLTVEAILRVLPE